MLVIGVCYFLPFFFNPAGSTSANYLIALHMYASVKGFSRCLCNCLSGQAPACLVSPLHRACSFYLAGLMYRKTDCSLCLTTAKNLPLLFRDLMHRKTDCSLCLTTAKNLPLLFRDLMHRKTDCSLCLTTAKNLPLLFRDLMHRKTDCSLCLTTAKNLPLLFRDLMHRKTDCSLCLTTAKNLPLLFRDLMHRKTDCSLCLTTPQIIIIAFSFVFLMVFRLWGAFLAPCHHLFYTNHTNLVYTCSPLLQQMSNRRDKLKHKAPSSRLMCDCLFWI